MRKLAAIQSHQSFIPGCGQIDVAMNLMHLLQTANYQLPTTYKRTPPIPVSFLPSNSNAP